MEDFGLSFLSHQLSPPSLPPSWQQKHVRHDPKHKARIVTLNSNAGIAPGQPNASCE
jgi:hypothetical protein